MGKFSWSADIYSKFLDYRTQPVYDLISRIPKDFQPKHILDLGCGAGNSTYALKERFPKSKIQGFDLSPQMLEKARATYPEIEFIQQDISHFEKPEKLDCIFSNAALQWLDNHNQVLNHYANHLNENGILAVQMPNNFHMPAHQSIILTLEKNPEWEKHINLLRYTKMESPLYSALDYDHLLMQAGLFPLAIWEIEYFHRMQNHQGIVDWMRGTGLRPILSNLDEVGQIDFLNAYTEKLKSYYSEAQDGSVLFSFKRLFFVALKVKK